jgi:hypothetical protein
MVGGLLAMIYDAAGLPVPALLLLGLVYIGEKGT